LATQGSISPFAKVVFHLKSKSRVSVTPFDLAIAKSGPHASRVASVVIVVVAVVVDIAEIVIVVVIRGTQPPPHRRGHINRDTPNFFEVKFSILNLHS
jgi:hypothetical protein